MDDADSQKHLRRLDRVFAGDAIYFVTTCTKNRRPLLTEERIHMILIDEWTSACELHGWQVGRYVVMPDHVHFFARASDEDNTKSLSDFIGAWKRWTSRRINIDLASRGAVWQPEFFDHVLRSSESYSEKWDYVRANPVRAGLVDSADEWVFAGEIGDLMW